MNARPTLSSLLARWQALRTELAARRVRLLAVSKYAPDVAVQALIDAGQRDFAESRPQALRDRARKWPQCRWHMIGPLQRNKAKYVARHAAMWHSVEHVAQARAVAAHLGERVLPVLIQVNLSGLAHQHGVAPHEADALCRQVAEIPGLRVCGLMGMAPRDGDAASAFRKLRALRDHCLDGSLRELSMGMSGDYPQAIEQGATMVRLGSVLFGAWDVRTWKEDGDVTNEA
ncbi:MAG: YggS family pyridoxal phosphate-dependent enzyme [Zetaproteobacteria bacterium]|nr:MAG: YggS family pyridoxal phosphate-dependent enzyme [Zetaproteobacteria bacterium]